MNDLHDVLWTEKYRPKSVAGCILPNNLKNTFHEFVNKKSIPNLLLTGRAGVGKTSVAKAMLDEIGADFITINGSMNGNIDTLRVDISQFASTMSFNGERKYVILDEADYLNPNSTQPALRNFMEEFSKNCGFILTCNFKNRIIEPLHSRCSVIDFTIPSTEKARMAMLFMKRLKTILDLEEVAYQDNIVAEFIKKHFPDWRRILNELQRYSSNSEKTIDSGILAAQNEENYKILFDYMKNKSFTNIRKWVAENSNIETSDMFRQIYDSAQNVFKPQSIPQLVLILGEYQFKAAFVADPEINIVACLTSIMVDCEFV
jgi:DNA polymerase III delta prime subunit